VRQAADDAADEAAVFVKRIRPPHRQQHAVAGVLQRQVEMR
jgi:hypothetical protein